MSLLVVDQGSFGSGGPVNEDRTGAQGDVAWVIDGATDVLDAPLTRFASDASWLAGCLHAELTRRAATASPDLRQLVRELTQQAARHFERVATRTPAHRGEHPSASGIIVHAVGRTLHYVSLGDCALVAGRRDRTVAALNIGTRDGGDAALARAIAAFHKASAEPSAAAARRHVWPKVQAKRAEMNTDGGYGVFSITQPPERFMVTDSLELPSGALVLLASDGLGRLVDVFARYTPATLLAAAADRGIAALVAELRALEAGDPECVAHPRAKVSDDATGLLLRVA